MDASWNLSLRLRYPQNLSPSFSVKLLGKIIHNIPDEIKHYSN